MKQPSLILPHFKPYYDFFHLKNDQAVPIGLLKGE